MYKLNVTMSFDVTNKDQAKFIVKQLNGVRKLVSNLLVSSASQMSSNVVKVD